MNRIYMILLVCFAVTGCMLEVEEGHSEGGWEEPRDLICAYERRETHSSQQTDNYEGPWISGCRNRSCALVETDINCYSGWGVSACDSVLYRHRIEYFGTCDDYAAGVELEPSPDVYPSGYDLPVEQSLSGVVTSSEGPVAPADVGDECSVEITPYDARGWNCRVRVSCGGNVIYGEDRGPNGNCSTDRPFLPQEVSMTETRMSDEDGDPWMRLRTREGGLTLEDRTTWGTWTVVIALDVPEY